MDYECKSITILKVVTLIARDEMVGVFERMREIMI